MENLLVMAIQGLVTVQDGPVQPIDGANEAFQSVSQIGYVGAPSQVDGQVPQGHSEASEHHHRY